MATGRSKHGESRRVRVLVCDDERHVVRLIQVNLERQGYEVATALSGQEAIELLKRGQFDLAVLDPAMPDVDGFDVKAWIGDHEETREMKVILLDGKPKNWGLWP